MSLSAEQKDAIEILVGLCMSSKDPPTMSQLLRDYTELEGKQLDYSGFNTITEFLRASDRFHLINRGGMLIVNAKLTSESVHIAVMVGKQRSTSKRRGRGAGPPTRVSSLSFVTYTKFVTFSFFFRMGCSTLQCLVKDLPRRLIQDQPAFDQSGL